MMITLSKAEAVLMGDASLQLGMQSQAEGFFYVPAMQCFPYVIFATIGLSISESCT